MTKTNIVDPTVLSSIVHLELIARKAVEGSVSGLHNSHYRGRSVEFIQHRPYNPGDELRYLDWRVYAKTNRYHVKLFEEDTNLRATILIDLSGSMRFADSTMSKADYARQMAAAFSYLMLKQGDSVGLVVFDREVRQYIPPRNRLDQWGTLIETLVQAETTQVESAIASVLSTAGEYLKKRGLVILISDLIDQPEGVLSNLALLRTQQHEIIVFHVLAPEEITLPYHGTVEFLPLEGEADHLLTSPRRLQKNYQERIKHFMSSYRNGCLELGVDYQRVTTDRPLEMLLREYLQRRMKK